MTDDRWAPDERAQLGAVRFFERLLTHPKGPLAGQPFVLEPWQRKIVAELFGTKDRRTGLRRYRRAYLELPRGTGKTSMAAGIALLLLVADSEPGAEIFGAAADRDQARLAFDIAKAMVEDSRHLSKLIKVYRNSLVVESTRSVYRVLSAEAYSKHGLNPHGIIFDELHAQPDRELYDVLNTAMGKRAQPLMIMITTAGYDRNSICWQQHEYARQVAAGIIDDPTYYPAIWSAPVDADWTAPETWRLANPNYGVSVQPDFLAQECEVAKSTPAYQNTFRRLYLNQWMQQESRWIDMGAWDACNGALPDLTGRKCYGGLDLASTTDIAACVLAFPKKPAMGLWGDQTGFGHAEEPVYLVPFFWIPQDSMIERERRDRVPYSTWVRQGLVEATPGNVIDYAYIRARINALKELYDIGEIAYDPWNATQLSLQLQDDGIVMVEMRQGFASMTAP
ncbi:MAG: terminase large subunit, partial [Caldilineaceae bacterium]|nr:terminase large subunit [Caldilineaceae bacterium]